MNLSGLLDLLAQGLKIDKLASVSASGLLTALALAIALLPAPNFLRDAKAARSSLNAALAPLDSTLAAARADSVRAQSGLNAILAAIQGRLNEAAALDSLYRTTLPERIEGGDPYPALRLQREQASSLGASLTATAAVQQEALTNAIRRIESSEAAADSLRAQLRESYRWGRASSSFDDAMASLLSLALGVLILGYFVGVALDPVSNVLLLGVMRQFVPVNLIRSVGGTASTLSEAMPSVVHPSGDRGAQYYIGKGVITREEYDALISSQRRHAETLVAAAAPSWALFTALGVRRVISLPLGLSLGFGVGLLFWLLGVIQYERFDERRKQFIEGRLQERAEEAAKEKAPPTPEPGRDEQLHDLQQQVEALVQAADAALDPKGFREKLGASLERIRKLIAGLGSSRAEK